MAATARHPIGKNIFDEEWDLAIILDACRVDALREIQDEYPFIDSIERVLSLGSSSKEWMVNTFRQEYRDEIGETVYLTGNGWAQSVFQGEVSFSTWTITEGTIFESNDIVDGLLHRPVVTETDFEDLILQPMSNINGIDAFPAEELTDYTIQVGRSRDAGRVIAHYMQPHTPYLHRVSNGQEPREIDQHPFELLRSGHERGPIWDAYLNNLRYCLDEIERLIENFDGDVVITSDHGELFGELSLHGHAEGVLHPDLKYVPWVRVSATDENTQDVDVSLPTTTTEDVDERLTALGYK